MKKHLFILLAVVLVAIAFFVNKKIEDKEDRAMMVLAEVISDESDPQFENAVSPIITQIKNDSLIGFWADNEQFPSDDSVLSYLDTNYFNLPIIDYYTRVATVCDSKTSLSFDYFDSEIDCNDYFLNVLNTNPIKQVNGGLINIDDATTDVYYLASIDFPNNQTLYLEFYRERTFNSVAFKHKNYSYGVYKNDILDYKYGYYLYPNNLNNFVVQSDGIYKARHYKHFLINDDETGKSVVVSLESERWMRYLAEFAFIFFALLLSYYFYLLHQNGRKSLFKKSFHGKIQLTIILTLAFAFLIVGITSSIFIKNNITRKTQISQYKQAIIIRNRLEVNLLDDDNLTEPGLLNSIKESFLCDINIYNLDGDLIISTLDETYDYSDAQIIDIEAFDAIYKDNAGYFIQTEYYGDERCSSYYFPILNKDNELVAIMNIPYFDANKEYDDRFSSFIFSYILIILILLGVSSIVILLITRTTLKPLKMIQDEMSKLNFGVVNKPISWKSNDEIGALIDQYNKMRWQLENAANRIARNERENAWREMARQVAHEIKNPLTPMQLNIEYLQMLWQRKDPKFEANFNETMHSLLDQIETLKSIATAYSNYAKLPDNNPTVFDLSELLTSTVKLYDIENNVLFTFKFDKKENWTMYADKNNLVRVFGNIIKNAIQAIGNAKTGQIDVILNRIGERYNVKISDNGCGIKEADRSKVFFPNFTTKSSGMGVGLSVSQDIVQNIGGNISFESREGFGTVFTIDLPILKEK